MLLQGILATLAIGVVAENKVEQVHLSLNGNPSEMVVTWITLKKLPNVHPYATYGLGMNKMSDTVKGTTKEWTDLGIKLKKRYTHRVTLNGLEPGNRYYYSVGSAEAMSQVFNFVQPDPRKPLRAAIYGDLSILNGYSIEPLINATQNGDFDVVFHIGDFAYDLDKKNGDMGDDFMNAIEGMTAYVPFMTVPGNHETEQLFNHYANRFTMPANGVYDNSMFWSIDYGTTHIIGLNTEYYAEGMPKEVQAQYEWLEEDLKKAQSAKWKIVMFHRPMYCSSKTADGCHDDDDIITREGNATYPGWEKLLKKNGVDLILYGHKHTYERMWPTYKSKSDVTGDPTHIHNAPYPVFILTGAAGCHSHTLANETIPQPFSAQRLSNFGYSILTIHNDTHLETNFKDTGDSNEGLVDPFLLTKD